MTQREKKAVELIRYMYSEYGLGSEECENYMRSL
jgi:hypothetical protein